MTAVYSVEDAIYVDEDIFEGTVAIDGRDAQNVDLTALVGVQCHEERHGVVHSSVRINQKLPRRRHFLLIMTRFCLTEGSSSSSFEKNVTLWCVIWLAVRFFFVLSY